jgi:hypothetical protein
LVTCYAVGARRVEDHLGKCSRPLTQCAGHRRDAVGAYPEPTSRDPSQRFGAVRAFCAWGRRGVTAPCGPGGRGTRAMGRCWLTNETFQVGARAVRPAPSPKFTLIVPPRTPWHDYEQLLCALMTSAT